MRRYPLALFPLLIPLCSPFLVPFTYLETLLAVTGSCPPRSQAACKLSPPFLDPSSFPPHSKLPVPNLYTPYYDDFKNPASLVRNKYDPFFILNFDDVLQTSFLEKNDKSLLNQPFLGTCSSPCPCPCPRLCPCPRPSPSPCPCPCPWPCTCTEHVRVHIPVNVHVHVHPRPCPRTHLSLHTV